MSFLDEIAEQGKVLRDLIEFYRGDGDDLISVVGRMMTRRPRSITFAGMGTSEFVPEVIRGYLGDGSRTPVILWEAGELLHHGMDSIRDDDIVVLTSQSGESVETRKVAELLRFHKHVLSVTNNPESTIARLSAMTFPMLAGEETSITTKTYTNSMALMILLSRGFAVQDRCPSLDLLARAADSMDDFLTTGVDEIERAAEHLREAQTVYFVSRGPGMAAAKQAALTFQEGARVFTCALPGGSMRHGPFEIVGPGHFAVLFASDGEGGDLLRNMAREMAELGSKVVLMTSIGVEAHPNLVSILLEPGPRRIGAGSPELFPFACAVPQELLLDRMAAHRGWTAGVFRRGGKVTEKE